MSQASYRCQGDRAIAGREAVSAILILFALKVLALVVILQPAVAQPLVAQEELTAKAGAGLESGLAAVVRGSAANLGGGRTVVAARLELERKEPSGSVAPVPEVRKIKRVPGTAFGPGRRDGRRGARAPWVAVRTLKPPVFEEDSFFRDSRGVDKLPFWYVENDLDRPIFDEPPPYVHYDPAPVFSIEPSTGTRFTRAARRLAERKFYVELRRKLKKEWRKNYDNSSGMTYDRFEEQLLLINEIGRKPHEYDLLVGDFYSNELKETLFKESYEGGERDIPLLAWGPFTIMDSGSMKVHFEKFFAVKDFLPQLGESEKEESGREGVLLSEEYRLDTNLRLRFDLGALFEKGDVPGLVESYGVSISVDWLSKVLGRELLTTEFEAEVDREGDYAFALNFILAGR